MDFLQTPEREEYRFISPESGTNPIALSIKNGNFTWDDVRVQGTPSVGGSGKRLTLTNLNLEVSRGKMVALIGAIGGGKSSILQALLGQIPKVSGQVAMNGTLSYVGQSVVLLPAVMM
jgi:ATP-binding cassette subfamily C (CFTR/MRP) protein 1